MRVKWNNVGVALAIVAGLFAIGVANWPITPQAQFAYFGPAWGLGVTLAGAGFVAAAFLADSRLVLAKVLLAGGAVLLIGSSIIFIVLGPLQGAEVPYAMVVDLVPAVLALIAAVLIGPIQRSAAEIQGRRVTPGTETRPEDRDRGHGRRAA